MSEDRPMSPEEIHQLSAADHRRLNDRYRRDFVDRGPPELQDMRLRMWSAREAAVHVITRKNRVKHELMQQELERPHALERLRSLREAIATAEAERERLKMEVQELEGVYRERCYEVEARAFPKENQAAAFALMRERDEMKSASASPGWAAESGGLAGTQFRILRELDAARARGDADAVGRLEADLEIAKKELQELTETEITDLKAAVTRIDEEFNQKLAALRGS